MQELQAELALGQASPEIAIARAWICSRNVAAMVSVRAYSFRGGFSRLPDCPLEATGFPEATRRILDGLVEDLGSWRPPKNLAVESPAHSLSCRNADCLLPHRASFRSSRPNAQDGSTGGSHVSGMADLQSRSCRNPLVILIFQVR